MALVFPVLLVLPGIGRSAELESDLIEITVSDRAPAERREWTGNSVSEEEIRSLAPFSLADVLRRIPGLSVQTNSRGETLVFIRNAGERQVATFYEGAPLNIPWDNRVNLALLPASALASVTVLKGVVPPAHGANISGGAVLVRGLDPRGGARSRFDLSAGEAGLLTLDGVHVLGDENRGLRLGFGYGRHGDVPLPDDARLPFNQLSSKERTNSGREVLNLDLRFESRIGEDLEAGFSLLAIDGEFDVPPEGTVDPGSGSPRFWRLPQWRLIMGIGSLAGETGSGLAFKSVFWTQSFAQTIDSFRTVAFEKLAGRQQDDDLGFGGRLLLAQPTRLGTLEFSLNAMSATHRQRDSNALDDGLDTGPRLTFRERTVSAALELRTDLADGLSASSSAGLDWKTTPKTGDKPAAGDFLQWSVSAGLEARPATGMLLWADIGRRARLPTMRELFGEALNRFLINPDLKAESSWIGEIGASFRKGPFRIHAAPFLVLTSDSIDQRNLILDGRRLRQRINLRGSRVHGIEIAAEVALPFDLSLEGHLTASEARRRRSAPDEPRLLSEKPELVAGATLSWVHDNWSAVFGLRHVGGAVTIDPDDIVVPLRRSTAFDLRVAHDLAERLGLAERFEIWLSIRNLTDTEVEPQLGLPDAGRWLSAGLSLSF